MSHKAKHLVVDSGAFIKNAAVHEYAENIYSVNGIVNEIRDKATKQRLQFLPYTLHLKDPEPENIKYVTEFSKKTGDYLTLSAVDIKIIALTYQLEKEHEGVDHLNKEPVCEVTGKRPESQQPFYGFYNPEDDEDETENDEGFTENSITSEENPVPEVKSCDPIISSVTNDVICEDTIHSQVSNNEINDRNQQNLKETHNGEDDEKENSYIQSDIIEKDSENDSDFESGDNTWITPSNLVEVQRKMGNLALDSESQSTVACITTDFAIQNVLLQMGLKVISVDGMLIKQAKVFILRCYACYRTTSDMTSKFCKNCGNKTLKRVSVSVNDDGEKVIHVNFKRPINIRGSKFSLPAPQGGKHAQNPHVCPDQSFPHNRPSKAALKKIDVLSPEYSEAVDSPFAFHDVYSRAALLGFHGHSQRPYRRNPNEWGVRTGNRKRNKK